MKRRDLIQGAAAMAVLWGCKADYPRASDAQVRAAYYHSNKPPSISLLSMIKESSDGSEHSGLLINGSQQVIYDPAGSYWTHNRPRKDDIHYGMNDLFITNYESFHARLGFYVARQTVEVPLYVADLAIAKAQERGETIMTQCASSASWVLRQLPGFESIPQTMSPNRLRHAFEQLPAVTTKITRETDEGQNLEAIKVEGFDPNDTAPPPKPEYGRGEF